MKVDYTKAPVTAPQARDMILEAHRLVGAHYPRCVNLVFVEFFEMPGLALISEHGAVFYHPDVVEMVCLDELCRMLNAVLIAYDEHLTKTFDIPAGTTLH